MQEMWLRFLGWGDPLKKEMSPALTGRFLFLICKKWIAIFFSSNSFLPGNPMDRRAWLSYSPWGHKEADTTYWLKNNHLKTSHGFISGILTWEVWKPSIARELFYTMEVAYAGKKKIPTKNAKPRSRVPWWSCWHKKPHFSSKYISHQNPFLLISSS